MPSRSESGYQRGGRLKRRRDEVCRGLGSGAGDESDGRQREHGEHASGDDGDVQPQRPGRQHPIRGRLLDPHRLHHPEVVVHRQRGVEHADDRQPPEAAVNGAGEQKQFRGEPAARGHAGETEQTDRHRCTGDRRLCRQAVVLLEGTLLETPADIPVLHKRDEQEGTGVHEAVHHQMDDAGAERQPLVAGSDVGGDANEHVPCVAHRGVREHPLDRLLGGRREVAECHRHDRQNRDHEHPVDPHRDTLGGGKAGDEHAEQQREPGSLRGR